MTCGPCMSKLFEKFDCCTIVVALRNDYDLFESMKIFCPKYYDKDLDKRVVAGSFHVC